MNVSWVSVVEAEVDWNIIISLCCCSIPIQAYTHKRTVTKKTNKNEKITHILESL